MGSKKDQQPENTNVNTADGFTDIEELKTKMRGLATFQIMKAKKIAPKDIDAEYMNVSK